MKPVSCLNHILTLKMSCVFGTCFLLYFIKIVCWLWFLILLVYQDLCNNIAELQRNEALWPVKKIEAKIVIEFYSFCSFLASCAQIPLGLDSGDIPFLWFTTQHPFTLPKNDSRSWCSSRWDNYIKLDLMFVHQICALNVISSQVHRWALWFSNDTKNWSKYFQVDTCQEMLNCLVVTSVKVARLTDVRPVSPHFFQLLFSF